MTKDVSEISFMGINDNADHIGIESPDFKQNKKRITFSKRPDNDVSSIP